jgi:hypothetical protein
MGKHLGLGAVILLLTATAWGQIEHSRHFQSRTTHLAKSCERADVASSIVISGAGDTILVPGGTCTWESPGGSNVPSISLTDRLLIGAGPGQTVIVDDTGALSNQNPINASGEFRVSGFTMLRTNTGTDAKASILATGKGWRIDNISFERPSGSSNMRGAILHGVGVIDSCSFAETVHGVDALYAFQDDGSDSWTEPLRLGEQEAVYIESNFFNYEQQWDGALDAYDGARYVFRRNRLTNTLLGHHGLDSSLGRSVFSYEIYRNRYHTTLSHAGGLSTTRGGTGLVFENVATTSGGGSYPIAHRIRNYRSDSFFIVHSSWLPYCDGTNETLDGNRVGLEGYPCADQTGRTTGAFQSQSLFPLMLWGNTVNGSEVVGTVQDTCTIETNPNCRMQNFHIVENRDFYNLVVGDTLTATGDSYSATYTADDGETPISWNYTPFVYPHPDRDNAGSVNSGIVFRGGF